MRVELNAKRDFKPAPVGSQVVRLVQMIDLGNQEFKGKIDHKIYLGFELPLELMENGKPFTVGKEVKISLGQYQGRDSTLRSIATALMGGTLTEAALADLAQDIFKLNGKAGLANICHKTSAAGNLRADLISVAPLPKGLTCPPAVNELVNFDLDSSNSVELVAKIPEFLKRKMKFGVAESHDGLDEVLGE